MSNQEQINELEGPLWNHKFEDHETWWKQNFNDPQFRLKQLNNWVYQQFTTDADKMLNLPQKIKEKINKISPTQLEHVDTLIASDNSADKYLYTCSDDSKLESVLLRDGKRRTVCLSTQVGCPLACTFCNTGLAGYKRNLSTAEIIEQILHISHRETERISNIVVMGMGEPMLNYDAMMIALRQINHADGLNIGARHITISTSGVKGAILKLAHEPEQFGLAVSLHAPNEKLRTSLMPINKSHSLEELMNEIKEYIKITNRRVTFEYIMLADSNSEKEHAHELANLLKGMLCHVNLIPYNPVPELPFEATAMRKIVDFQNIIKRGFIPCTIRIEKGQDILAACGQLAHKKK